MSHFVPAGASSLHLLHIGRRCEGEQGPGLVNDSAWNRATNQATRSWLQRILPWTMDGLLSSTGATELPHGIFS